MNIPFDIVVRLFIEASNSRLIEIKKELESRFFTKVFSEEYYKFEGWYEVFFYLSYKNKQNYFLKKVAEDLGGNWEVTLGEHDDDYSGDAIWNPDMGGKLIFPEVRFGNLLVATKK